MSESRHRLMPLRTLNLNALSLNWSYVGGHHWHHIFYQMRWSLSCERLNRCSGVFALQESHTDVLVLPGLTPYPASPYRDLPCVDDLG